MRCKTRNFCYHCNQHKEEMFNLRKCRDCKRAQDRVHKEQQVMRKKELEYYYSIPNHMLDIFRKSADFLKRPIT